MDAREDQNAVASASCSLRCVSAAIIDKGQDGVPMMHYHSVGSA